jgi:cysteine synthase A
MGKVYHSLRELVGHTPLFEFDRYEEALGLEAHIFGKLEYFNPSGSVKDRIAVSMIQAAEQQGKIKPGDTILDFTSGNTGIATATYANASGYHYATVIQPGVSEERSLILNALGVELLHAQDVPGFMEMLAEGLRMQKLDEIMEAYAASKGYFYISQASNPANMQAHYDHTAPEIWDGMDGKIDYFVACVGTGGTLAGVSKFLREKNPDIKIISAQPAEASRRTPEHPKPKVIDGILVFDGGGSLPTYFDAEHPCYDECINVVAEDAYAVGRKIAKTDGVFLGQSSGAALYAATQIAKRPEAKGKNIVAVLADNAFKYLSTQMYRIKD